MFEWNLKNNSEELLRSLVYVRFSLQYFYLVEWLKNWNVFFQIWKTRDAWRWFRTPVQSWTLLLNLWKFFKSHFLLPNLTKATDNCAALFPIWWIVLPLSFHWHFFRKVRLPLRVLRILLMTVAKQFIHFILRNM